MPVNLGNPDWITLIADANTPDWLQPYDQARVAVPAGTQLPQTIDYLTISGAQVWGYARGGASGPEWVMQPPQSPIVTAVNTIPGPQGWTDLDARQEYYDIGLALLQLGVPGPELAPGLRRLFAAAVAEHQAQN